MFQEVARVSLQHILFFLEGIDEDKVLRLMNTFLAEECLHHKKMNHITALVDDRRLDEALHKANLDRETLLLTKSNNEEHSMLTFLADYTLCELHSYTAAVATCDVYCFSSHAHSSQLFVMKEC